MSVSSGSLKQHRVRVMLTACALVIGISLHRLFLVKGSLEGHFSENLLETSSLKNSSHGIKPAQGMDPEGYRVFDNSCLVPKGLYKWTVRVKSNSSLRKAGPPKATFKYRVFYGGGDFVHHKFKVVHDEHLDVAGAGVQTRKGSYMLLTNTHANNYHIINDFLLPAFRARLKLRINGLLVPAGCEDCWRGSLPLQSMGIDMLNLSVVYPLENATSMDAPMCFDRLIVQQFKEHPYYRKKERFSRWWPRQIFINFRDSAHDYFRKLVRFDVFEHEVLGNNSEVAKTVGIQPSRRDEKAANSTHDAAQTSSKQSSRPVLSWMSRSTWGRRITNEQEVVTQLSKYFHVNMIDFNAGLTTEQAMAYVMNTDVLIGLHGAGLAYTAFLPDRAMLVELRSNYSNRMFINMASSMNVPYYAMSLGGCIGPGLDDVFTLPSSIMREMTEDIYSAYLHEKHLFSQGQPLSFGECDFPQPIDPCGRLSTTNESRCYRQSFRPWWRPLQKQWRQCAWHDVC